MLKTPRSIKRWHVLTLMLGGSILLYLLLATPPMSRDFPQVITDQLKKQSDLYFPDFEHNLRYFCFVGGYENVDEFLQERGIENDIDLYVNENDTVLVLVTQDYGLRYRTFGSAELNVDFDVYGCYPPAHNRLVFIPESGKFGRPFRLVAERVKERTKP